MQRKAIKNDRYKTALAESSGYKLIRVWEKDFNTKPDNVKENILNFIKNNINLNIPK